MTEDRRPTVWFTDLRTSSRRNLLGKLGELLGLLSLGERFSKGSLVAIKLHFGERGNMSYLSPVFVRHVVDKVKETGARPFLTDTNTLYVASRTNSVSHIETAIAHGFDYSVAGAPVIIADGLRGESRADIKVAGGALDRVHIAAEIADADAMVVLTHFKGHELSGFGGTLKNIGMGCASRAGKLVQHSNCAPEIEADECFACGDCARSCPADAIEVADVASIDDKLCIGCGHCIAVCPEGAVKIVWDATTRDMQEKMAEYAAGALKGKEGKVVFINFITKVSPYCDCYGHNDAPIVHDIGILASTDPVAIDQASVDLVNAATGVEESALKSGHEPGGDKFRGVHPEVEWAVQLERAEELGIGSRDYDLEKI